MSKDSIGDIERASHPVLGHLLALLEAHRSAFAQERVFARAEALALGQYLSLGRHTLTQSLVALGLVQDDWTAFYRILEQPRLDREELVRCLLGETLTHTPLEGPYAVVVDGVHVPRHSRTMPGTSWAKDAHTPAWKPGIRRAQRFVDIAWLTPPSPSGYRRAVPIEWAAALPEKAVRPVDVPAQKEWEAALGRVRWLRKELDKEGRTEQRLLVIGDGSYSGKGVWAQLPERTTLLARCARNRALYGLPPREARGRGRRRKYGEKARHPHEWLAEGSGWQRTQLRVRGRTIPVTYRVEGPYVVKGAPEQPLFLLVVKGIDRRVNGRTRRREPAYWLVSAVECDGRWVLPWPAEDLLGWAWQRWEVEVSHREMKAGLGVGEIQCWGKVSAILAVQWQVWTYSLLVLAGYRSWGLEGGPQPVGRWWRGGKRWSFSRLWQAFRQECWGSQEFRRVWTGPGTNWTKKELWLAAKANAVQGLQRA